MNSYYSATIFIPPDAFMMVDNWKSHHIVVIFRDEGWKQFGVLWGQHRTSALLSSLLYGFNSTTS
jgi:hypothetical protein